jgi:hypothetical protein
MALLRQGKLSMYCTDEFEGRHCQYLKGITAPDERTQTCILYAEERNKVSGVVVVAFWEWLESSLLLCSRIGIMAKKEESSLADLKLHLKLQESLDDAEKEVSWIDLSGWHFLDDEYRMPPIKSPGRRWIHHKTSLHGGPHGFPDPIYPGNCNAPLDPLLVSPADLKMTAPSNERTLVEYVYWGYNLYVTREGEIDIPRLFCISVF